MHSSFTSKYQHVQQKIVCKMIHIPKLRGSRSKKPPPIRGEGVLRGTTLLASPFQDDPGTVKPLWIALSGDSRRRLICSDPTHVMLGWPFTNGTCQNWQGRRVRTCWGAPGAPCWAHTSLSQLAVG